MIHTYLVIDLYLFIIFIKPNLRKTWQLIKKHVKTSELRDFPGEFFVDNLKITDTRDISNHFNNYFGNIGEIMAKQIKEASCVYRDFLGKNKVSTCFQLC